MKKIIVSIVIIVLVIGAAGAIAYYHHAKKVTAPSQEAASDQPQPQFAAAGQLTAGLPKDLVLGQNVVPNSSYVIPYTQSNQSTAVYDTTDTVNGIYNQYLTYLQKNGYEVLSKSESTNVNTIYAIISGNNANDVNISIKPDGPKTEVVLSYLKK